MRTAYRVPCTVAPQAVLDYGILIPCTVCQAVLDYGILICIPNPNPNPNHRRCSTTGS